jgi:hypothetical protein
MDMAKQAGFWKDLFAYPEFKEHIKAFAALVAAAEREACAKLCDYVYDNIVTDEHIKDMAFKIRARGKTK